MKLAGMVSVRVAGEDILRQPRFWDKVKSTFGGSPDLRTGRRKAALEAAAVVDAVRDALRSIGVNNAVSLVVDDLVLYQDRDGRADDLGDLFLAFHEQSDAVGGDFKVLRLAVEHLEAGLHLVLEVQARGEHADHEEAVRVVIAGRIHDLEPRKGEDAETYRKRVEPLTKDKAMIDVARMQFESFVARVRDAIQRAMPESNAEVVRAEAQIQRPGPDAKDKAAPSPDSRHYDPYDNYYPSPMGMVMNMMMWSAIFSMAMPPHVTVINQAGEPVGTADTPGIEQGDPAPAEAGGDDGGDVGGDAGGGDFGGDAGGDAGGDFGDAGGGDFGGFFD